MQNYQYFDLAQKIMIFFIPGQNFGIFASPTKGMDTFLFEMSMKLLFTFKNFRNVYWHGKTHSAMCPMRTIEDEVGNNDHKKWPIKNKKKMCINVAFKAQRLFHVLVPWERLKLRKYLQSQEEHLSLKRCNIQCTQNIIRPLDHPLKTSFRF